jgi:hypothetical protein
MSVFPYVMRKVSYKSIQQHQGQSSYFHTLVSTDFLQFITQVQPLHKHNQERNQIRSQVTNIFPQFLCPLSIEVHRCSGRYNWNWRNISCFKPVVNKCIYVTPRTSNIQLLLVRACCNISSQSPA